MRKSKKMLALGLATAMTASAVLTGCGGSNDAAPAENAGSTTTADGEVAKPEKIKIMVDGTVFTQQNKRDEFEKRWEELTGIDLEITQPDHDAYYDVLGQTFASGVENWPDAIILSSSYYTGYAEEGALWDMTEAYENSDLFKSERFHGQEIEENLKIDGKLYGFAPTRGNGCITYVKKAWLDNVGMEVPTNFAEYQAMMEAFTTGDPDGNGVNGDTYAIATPGLIGTEAPFTNYLPEFYQGATTTFIKDENGKWVDGFTQPNMADALVRLQDAYAKGYIDKESLTNGTNDCRNKFYEDKFGVFTYWAGTWATNLKVNLEANGRDSELVALPPIAEVGKYDERVSPVWCITAACENPEGVFKYLIESMLDGGDMQTLWTYGVEDVHWSKKAEEVCGNTYAEGEFHFRESFEKPGTQYTKNHIDPMLSVSDFEGEAPGASAIAAEAKASQETFNSNAKQAPLVPSSDMFAQYNGDLTTLKNSIIADIITQGMSVEEGMARFEAEGGAEWSAAIVESLNSAG